MAKGVDSLKSRISVAMGSIGILFLVCIIGFSGLTVATSILGVNQNTIQKEWNALRTSYPGLCDHMEGNIEIDCLSNVNTSGVSVGDFLVYSASGFVPGSPAGGSVPDPLLLANGLKSFNKSGSTSPDSSDNSYNFQWGTGDAFGRAQLLHKITFDNDPDDSSGAYGGKGPILRLGTLAADGDAANIISEGIVVYGQDRATEMNSTQFSFARIKPQRFQLRVEPYDSVGQINVFQVDNDELTFRDATSTGNDFRAQKSGTTVGTGVGSEIATLILKNYANLNFADDSAAATGGIGLGGVYHTSGALKVRIA